MSYKTQRKFVQLWHWADRNRIPIVGYVCHKIYWKYVAGGNF